MKRIPFALLLLAAPAHAQGSKAPETALQRIGALPEELAGWRRGAVTDFEQGPNGAGLGAGVEYRPVAGGAGVATVYLYDRGLATLPEGIDSPSLAAELTQAVRDVEVLGPQRRYRVDGRLAAAPVVASDGRPALRCESLALAFEGGNRADSFLCVGVVRGQFLKLRMTLPLGPPETAAKVVQAMGQAVVAVAAR